MPGPSSAYTSRDHESREATKKYICPRFLLICIEYQTFEPRQPAGATVEVGALDQVRAGSPLPVVDNVNQDELAYTWNWGVHRTADPRRAFREAVEHFKARPSLVIDQSLIADLKTKLYPLDPFDKGISPELETTTLFIGLHKKATQFLNAIILRLDVSEAFDSGRPIAHVIADVIGCIKLVREHAGNEINPNLYCEIDDRRKKYWQNLCTATVHIN